MSDVVLSRVLWLLLTLTLAIAIDRSILWLIPRIVSWMAIARIRRVAGGVNKLVYHGLNTPQNCRTPLSTADALMTLLPFDVSNVSLRLSITIPDETYWSISCYGPNSDCVFVMNDQQVIQRSGRDVTLILHVENARVATNGGEIAIPLKSCSGIALIRTVVPNVACQTSLERLKENQRSAVCRSFE